MSGSTSNKAVLGKHTIEIKPEKLNIVWSKDKRYWRLIEDKDGQEGSGYAELLQVCWLEVTGEARGIKPSKKYSVGFTISFNQEMFGWDNCPIYLMARVGKKEKYKWNKIVIDTSKKGTDPFDIPVDGSLILETPDTLDSSSCGDVIYFGLYEVWSGKWKGGLKIHRAFVREEIETNQLRAASMSMQ